MKTEPYRVVFKDGTSCVKWAFSGEQAKILAQARRIKNGESYEVETVEWIGG